MIDPKDLDREILAEIVSPDEGFTIAWSDSKKGFGEFVFYQKSGKWKIDNETCGREYIKKILGVLVDSLELKD